MISPDLALRVHTFGQLHITLNGRALTFRMSKVVGLLVYLMREGEKNHSREQLASLLWPEVDRRKGAENLRQALYQLRRAFGEAAATYFTINRAAVQFNLASPHTLDANQFEEAIAQQDWATAVELYQGEFLASFHAENSILFAEWQLVAREHFHQLAGRAIAQLAEQAEKDGNHGRAEEAAQRLLVLEPWAEEGHRLLMRLWARQGQPARAIVQYEKCAHLLAEQLGTTPATETTALYEQIRDGRWPPPDPVTRAPSHPLTRRLVSNLPASFTPLVARETELAELEQMLAQPDCRLVTITGPGGMGKTKLLLAMGWASHHARRYRDGTLFASLAELEPTTGEPVAEQIAAHLMRQLGESARATDRVSDTAMLIELLHGRELLLLLDNCEHLLAGISLLVDLLAALPGLEIVATSRAPLNLYGEWLFPLDGLPLPISPGDHGGAVQLFVHGARRVQPRFQLDETTAPIVHAICHTLGGHPLALEMAAAALRSLTLAEVAEEVATGLDLLTTDQPNMPSRQRDLRQLLAYSWRQLSPIEQDILAQLSLFRQPFTIAGAQAVTGARLVQMATLVTRSWLRRTADGRYQYHELLRHFAREQLTQRPGQQATAERNYIRYHLTRLAQRKEAMRQLLPDKMLLELTNSWADVERAWTGGLSRQMWPELAGAIPIMGLFYERKGLLAAGIRLFAAAAEQVETYLQQATTDHAARHTLALLLLRQGILRNILVRSNPVPALMARAHELAVEIGDAELQMATKVTLVRGFIRLGRLLEAQDTALALLAQTNPPPTPSQKVELWACLGNNYFHLGNFARSEHYLGEALRYYEATGLYREAIPVRHHLALTLCHTGQYLPARRLFQTNLAVQRVHPSLSYLAMTREGLGYVYLRLGRLVAAVNHLQAAMRLYEVLEDDDGIAYASLYLGQIAAAREAWETAETYYHTAVRLRLKENRPGLLPQPWAGLVEVAWRQGRMAVAQGYLADVVPALLAEEIDGEDTGRAYEVVGAVLQEMGDERAEGVLAVAQRRARADGKLPLQVNGRPDNQKSVYPFPPLT